MQGTSRATSRTITYAKTAAQRQRYATASASSTSSPVNLAFDSYASSSPMGTGTSASPLVIIHGLFGSKQNWRSLSRSLAQKTARDVFALDLRNHGTSPHDASTTYVHYASDVSAFFKAQGLADPILMGHSMGGKVAMTQALLDSASISKLISVDMSPARGRISPEFAKYIDGMRAVDAAQVRSKKDADAILKDYEPSLPIRQFLLTNLIQKNKDEPFSFRLPLDILHESIHNIGDFPVTEADGVTFDKPTLFIKGADSKYINRKNVPVAEALFPNSRLEVVQGAGHWVHSEKPKEFVDIVTAFCAEA